MSAFSEKRRFCRISVNFSFWHKAEIRRSGTFRESCGAIKFATRGKERLQCGGKLSAINQEGESMSEQLNCQSRMRCGDNSVLAANNYPRPAKPMT